MRKRLGKRLVERTLVAKRDETSEIIHTPKGEDQSFMQLSFLSLNEKEEIKKKVVASAKAFIVVAVKVVMVTPTALTVVVVILKMTRRYIH